MNADGHSALEQQAAGHRPPAPPRMVHPRGAWSQPTCLVCGSSLRGLHSDRRCPGCGLPAGRSLHGPFLRFADPRYVRRLATGTTLVLCGLATGVLGTLLAGAIVRATALTAPLAPATALVAGLTVLAGGWLITLPDPEPMDARRARTLRLIARVCPLTGLAKAVADLALTVGGATIGGQLAPAGAVALLVPWAAWAVLGLYLRRLALRVPDRHLARSTARAVGGLLLGSGVLLTIMLLGRPVLLMVVGEPPDAEPGAGLVLWASLGGAMLVFFVIWWAGLLVLYRRHFLEQAAWAARTWHAEPLDSPSPLPGTPG